SSAEERVPTVRLWSAGTRKLVRQLAGDRTTFSCLAFSPDGKILAGGEGEGGIPLLGARLPDKPVRLWDVSTGQEIRQLRGTAGGAHAVAFAPDGQMLATGGHADLAIRLWDVQTGQERARLVRATDPAVPTGLEEGTSSLVFAPDGRTVAAVSY